MEGVAGSARPILRPIIRLTMRKCVKALIIALAPLVLAQFAFAPALAQMPAPMDASASVPAPAPIAAPASVPAPAPIATSTDAPAPNPAELSSRIDRIAQVAVNGELVYFPPDEQKPVVINSRTYIPVRFVVETMMGDIEWRQQTQTIIIRRNDTKLALQIGNELMSTNNQGVIVMDVAPILLERRTLIPIRFVAEALGAMVAWDSKTDTVLIMDEYSRMIKEPLDSVGDMPPPPVASIGDRETYDHEINVRLYAGKGSTIFYTLDGSRPIRSVSDVFTDDIILSRNTTLRAIAVDTDGVASEVATYHYKFRLPKI